MKTNLLKFILFFCVGAMLTSCAGDEPSSGETAAAARKAADIPILPKEEIPEQNFDFGKFPNQWFALTKKGSEMVIEEPCDLDNRELRITNDNGHFQLYENMGDDGIDYTILSFEKTAPNVISIRVRVPQTKKEQVFLCTHDEANGTAVWKYQHEFGIKDAHELTFVDAQHAKNFRKIACE